MNVDLLEKALRQPKPFTLHLTDGRQIDVPHPEFLWLVIVSIFRPDNKAA